MSLDALVHKIYLWTHCIFETRALALRDEYNLWNAVTEICKNNDENAGGEEIVIGDKRVEMLESNKKVENLEETANSLSGFHLKDSDVR